MKEINYCVICGTQTKFGGRTCCREHADQLKKQEKREIRDCKVCNKPFEVKKTVKKEICSDECRKEWASRPENKEYRTQKQIEATIEKYGVRSTSQIPDVVEKMKQTKKERYGDGESITEKVKQTKKERYGNENYNNTEKNKETKQERYGDENYNNREAAHNTMKELYGVDHAMKLTEFQEKAKKTNLEKYGTEFPMQNEGIQQKAVQTNMEKYGVPYVSQYPEFKIKISEALSKEKHYINCPICGELMEDNHKFCSRECFEEFKYHSTREHRNCKICNTDFEVYIISEKEICSDECRKIWAAMPENVEKSLEKRKNTIKEKYGVENHFILKEFQLKAEQTNIEKYGVKNIFLIEEFQRRVEQTNLEKYGVKNVFLLEEFQKKAKDTKKEKYGDENYNNKEKAKQTNLEKYGVEYYSQTDECKIKTKETNLKNFGVEHHLQDAERFEKYFKQRCELKQYKDSDLYYRGSYELYFLLQMENIGEIGCIKKGKSFKYTFDNKNRVYHSDFLYKNLNIEIKSGWTYNKNGTDIQLENNNKAKWQSVIDIGEKIMVLFSKEDIDKFVQTIINKKGE